MLHRADFHIHSCLSPCGGLDMAPSAIVRTALERGLTAAAIADHNSAKNCPPFAALCKRQGLACLFGMEVNTSEEIHVLCLFDDLGAVMALDAFIAGRLPDIPNQPERFGDQVYVNEDDEIEGCVQTWLIVAADVAIGELLSRVHHLGGLFVPAHVDRMSNSLSSQLGFVPDEPFDAVEVSPHYDRAGDTLHLVGRYPIIRNSDAHALEQIGQGTHAFEVEQWSSASIRAAWCRSMCR